MKNLNFTLEQGKNTALVGSSGSGKTTTTRLLTRLYDVTSGDILIDGRDIRDYSLASLRKNVGVVSQDIELADFVAELPEGIETQVGERGIKLSDGQKQRIAIARVFLKDAPILILDEATAFLDNESERYIQGSLLNLLEQKTSLVIAHRLSTIHNADTILVMDKGEIVEQGTHEELLTRSGRYQELYQAQFM